MKRMALVLTLAVLGLSLLAAPAAALYPPAQDAGASIPAGSTTVQYSARDPITYQYRDESWTLSQGDQRYLESLQVDKGIVTWIARYKNFADTEYNYEIHCRIYDPGRGVWKGVYYTWTSGSQREISQHQVKDGVVAYKAKRKVETNPIETFAYATTYEPAYGTWINWWKNHLEPVSVENLRVKDGVVAYPLNPLNSKPLYYVMAIYDQALQRWVENSTQYRFFSEFDWMEIGDGTVHLHGGNSWPIPDDEVFDYYDPFSHNWNLAYKNWPNPVRRASFAVQPSSGYAPLVACFWDTSFAMNSQPGTWTYNFGDGMVDHNRSWVHTYWNAGTFPISLSVNYGGQNYLADGRTVQVNQYLPPAGGITINGGAVYTDSLNVTLQLNYNASATQMCFINLPGFLEWTAWESVAPSKSWQLSTFGFAGQPLDGVKTVYVKFRDGTGVESPTYQTAIILDLTPPAPMLILNYGHDTTRDPNIRVEWNAIDANGVAKMHYTAFNEGDPFNLWTPWTDYQSTVMTIPFNSKPGNKTVMVEFMDVAGNVTQVQGSARLIRNNLPFLLLLLGD